MNNADIKDSLFSEAVAAIDAGNLPALTILLNNHPQLLSKRLEYPDRGYFKNPYLLWYVAGNPIRQETLPGNIVAVTQLLVQRVQHHTPKTFQQQIDYTLDLVATGRIAHECGVQIALMDVLIDAGAIPGNAHAALAHGNLAAAQHIIERGGALTLATAICLDKTDELLQLAKESVAADREIALVAAAFYGKAEMLQFLIKLGVNVNARLDASSGFHEHATALHQAVFSGSLDAVKVLVESGADTNAMDRIFNGTPMDWARHMQKEIHDETAKNKYTAIEILLDNKQDK